MQIQKECPPGSCLEERQYILDGDFEDPVRKGFVVEKEISYDNSMQIYCRLHLLLMKNTLYGC